MTHHLNADSGPQLTFRPPRPWRDHFITGTPQQLAAIWNNHREAGTLITWLQPRPLDDGTYELMLRLRTTPPVTPPRPSPPAAAPQTRPVPDYRPRIAGRTAALLTAALAAVTGLIAVAAFLLGQLVHRLTDPAAPILGDLGVLAVLTGLGIRRSGRRHCPGC